MEDTIYHFMGLILQTIIEHHQTTTTLFSACIALLIFLGLSPLTTKTEASTHELLTALTRRFLLVSLLVVVPIFTLMVYILSLKLTGDSALFDEFVDLSFFGFKGSWAFYAALITGTLTVKFTLARVIQPYVSHWLRKFRVTQINKKLSDIREELNNLSSLDFDPRDYFKEGYMFLGLDENRKPIYEADADFKKRHIKVVGPTQTGKGVIQGVLIYQTILKGWTTGFFDIKPDDFIYSIMCKACKDAGRPKPVVVDLNGVGPGYYNMFTNGTSREILSRLQTAVNVNEKGTNADFYSANERSLMIDIQEYFDGSLKTLEQLLMGILPNGKKKPEYYDITHKSRAYVKEMKSHKPLNPKKGRGFNVDKTLKSNAVFYIRGSITDKLVRKAQTILLMDIIQSVLRLGKQEKHFYLAIDEVKFIVSDMLSTGLSTVLSKGMNISIAYQTLSNLMSLEDTTLNAKAIKSEIEVNTLTTISYRSGDMETATWASELTGTKNIAITKSEELEYANSLGADKFTGTKRLDHDQEAVIPTNRMSALPERAGIIIRPNTLSEILYTCWIPLEPNEFVDIIDKSKDDTQPTNERQTETMSEEETYSYQDFLNEAEIEH